MDSKDAVKAALKEFIAPDLDEIKATLVLTNKRLDDINLHLADQSRRIDSVREELSQRIDDFRVELRDEMAKTNRRLDRLYEVIVRRDEHYKLDERVAHLEREVNELKRRAA